jgi:hypothetical protein
MKAYIALVSAFAFILTLAPARQAMAAYEASGASVAAVAKVQSSARKQADPRMMIAKVKYQQSKSEDKPP